EPVAQRSGALQPGREEVRVDGRIEAAGQDAGGDQRMRVEEGEREGPAIGAQQPHERARRQRLGARVHDDLVGIDPGMAEEQTPVRLGPKGDAAHGRSVPGAMAPGKAYPALTAAWRSAG